MTEEKIQELCNRLDLISDPTERDEALRELRELLREYVSEMRANESKRQAQPGECSDATPV